MHRLKPSHFRVARRIKVNFARTKNMPVSIPTEEPKVNCDLPQKKRDTFDPPRKNQDQFDPELEIKSISIPILQVKF